MQIILADGLPATFSNPGLELLFIPESTTTPIDSITSANVAALTTKANSVHIALGSDGTENTDCLKLDGIYNQGSDTNLCTNELWYFILCTFYHFSHGDALTFCFLGG